MVKLPSFFLFLCLCMSVLGERNLLRAEELSPSTSSLEASSPQASTQEKIFGSPELMEDPFEGWNRFSLNLNEGLDRFFFLPTLDLYGALTPPIVRAGISHSLQNLIEPLWMVNFLLQGKMEKAGRSLGRFLINTIFGLLGLFDVAAEWENLEPEPTDFGSTLQHWGGPPGPYVIWPVLGPSCARDSFGIIMDFFLSPIDMICLWKKKYDWVDGHAALFFADKKMEYRKAIEYLKETSLDYYAALRSLYGLKISARNERPISLEEEGPIPLQNDEGPAPLDDDGPKPL